MALAIATFATFAIALRNYFVNLDDIENLLINRFYRGLSPFHVKWAFRTTLLGVYQPFSWLLFSVQYVMFGLRPWGYHLVSVLLHVANVVALYRVTSAVLRRAFPEGKWADVEIMSGWATAFYALHPLRTQVAVWASCQPYLPSALFYLLAIGCHLRAQDDPKPNRWRAATLVCYGVALMFKAIAITLPMVLLIIDYYPLRRREWKRVIAEKVPFALLAAVFTWAAVAAKPIVSLEAEGLATRVGRVCHAVWFYLARIALPINLSPYYPLPKISGEVKVTLWLSTVAFVAVTAAIIRLRDRLPALLPTWAAFLVILAPNIGIVRVFNEQIGSDRYTYLAAMPITIALAGLGIGAKARFEQIPQHVARFFGVCVLTVLAALSVRQTLIWRDSIALWTYAMNHGAGAEAYCDLAMEYYNRDEVDRAIDLYHQALQLDPNHREAHMNLGMALGVKQRYQEAVEQFVETLQIAPGYAQAHFLLGVALSGLHRTAEAIEQYRLAILRDPQHVQARINLGKLLLEQGKTDDAISIFRDSVELDPISPDVRNSLGNALLEKRDVLGALAEFGKAVELDPDRAEYRMSLGTALANLKRIAEATGEFRRAVELNPSLADAHYDLGLILARQNRIDEAKQQMNEAVRLQPENVRAQRVLKDLLAGRTP